MIRRPTSDDIEYIRARVAQGRSQQDIALDLDIEQSTVSRWMRRFEIDPAHPPGRPADDWRNPPTRPGDTCLPAAAYINKKWTPKKDATIVVAARQKVMVDEVREFFGYQDPSAISKRCCFLRQNGLAVPRFITIRPEHLHCEVMPAPLWSDEEIAERYRIAGIRYQDSDKAKPDPRRFVSHREIAVSLGGAAAMCAGS